MRIRSDAARRVIFEGLPFELDPTRTDQAGWGVVVPEEDADPAREALGPLLALRGQAVPADRLKVLSYRAGETAVSWLSRHGAYPGTITPRRVPYFLLIAAGPEVVPWSFQAAISLEYAVGRAAFDTAAELRSYARSVVEYEAGRSPSRSREVAFWATRHPGDPATRMSADHLVSRLWQGRPPDESPIAETGRFSARGFVGDSATRRNLSALLRGPDRPAVLVTASHGVGPDRDEMDVPEGLLTQDWDGFGPMGREHVFTAGDVGDEAVVAGLFALIFACHGAGTETRVGARTSLTNPPPRAAVSALAKRLMGHPSGGAMAILGHVGRAWGYSIRPPGLSPQIGPLRNFLGRVLRGRARRPRDKGLRRSPRRDDFRDARCPGRRSPEDRAGRRPRFRPPGRPGGQIKV